MYFNEEEKNEKQNTFLLILHYFTLLFLPFTLVIMFPNIVDINQN